MKPLFDSYANDSAKPIDDSEYCNSTECVYLAVPIAARSARIEFFVGENEISSTSKINDSTEFARSVLLGGLLGVLWLWFCLLATLIFVVPKYEKTFAENRMAIPRITEWIIEIARWCVKYWYVVVVMIDLESLARGAWRGRLSPP
jgi:hypothetical protein